MSDEIKIGWFYKEKSTRNIVIVIKKEIHVNFYGGYRNTISYCFMNDPELEKSFDFTFIKDFDTSNGKQILEEFL